MPISAVGFNLVVTALCIQWSIILNGWWVGVLLFETTICEAIYPCVCVCVGIGCWVFGCVHEPSV